MAEKRNLGKFFVYGGLILIWLLVMVPIIFSFKGKLVRAEVLIFLFLMLLSLTGFWGYRGKWGERVLFFVFLIGLGNLIFIWYFTGKLFTLPLFLTIVGFLMGLPRRGGEEEEEREEEEPYSEIFEEKAEPASSALQERVEERVKYSPGKYVASKMGSVYHEPRCEWAKKIAEGRRVWFEDKKEARSKGYKAHGCVE